MPKILKSIKRIFKNTDKVPPSPKTEKALSKKDKAALKKQKKSQRTGFPFAPSPRSAQSPSQKNGSKSFSSPSHATPSPPRENKSQSPLRSPFSVTSPHGSSISHNSKQLTLSGQSNHPSSANSKYSDLAASKYLAKSFSSDDGENQLNKSNRLSKAQLQQHQMRLGFNCNVNEQTPYLGHTPASSSDFCLSTDVEDEEYNRIKKQMEGQGNPLESSASAEEDALFPGLGRNTFSSAEEDFFKDAPIHTGALSPSMQKDPEDDRTAWSPTPQQQLEEVLTSPKQTGANTHTPTSNAMYEDEMGRTGSSKSSGTKKNKERKQNDALYPDSSDSEFEGEESLPLAGELCLASPPSGGQSDSKLITRSPISMEVADMVSPRNESSIFLKPTAAKSLADDLMSPSAPKVQDSKFEAFDVNFDDFVQGSWPSSNPANEEKTTSRSKSKENLSGMQVFSPRSGAQRSGGSVSSAPVWEKSSNEIVLDHSNRGSRSVSPMSSRISSPRYDQFSPKGTTRILDKLEHDLKEKRAKHNGGDIAGGSAKEPSREKARSSRPIAPTKEAKKKKKSRRSPVSRAGRSADESSEEENDWLFDEVTDTLGPRGVTADMESLSGRSNRSKTSVGNRSHHSTSRRRSSRRHKSSGASVTSRTSRASHHSHRSTRSHMSDASRTVANDLLRLEMQLAMHGASNDNSGGGSVSGNSAILDGASYASGHLKSPASVSGSAGGVSRASRTSRSSRATRTKGGSTSRNRVTVVAPPGKLGIILANKTDSKGTVVSGVRTVSVLAEKIFPGDRIVAVDGEDVSRMNVSELTTIMTRKGDFERSLTVITTPRQGSTSLKSSLGREHVSGDACSQVGGSVTGSHFSHQGR
eukprot:CAMPEP_0195513610 /NCGR_PEP_ID=MMETSP0794_2-20130614/5222_1 /TAXON_ID=515487 /ORGANISM="Stephanopyxis turris, Strain CCMP 815" /LENGTH=865 /DNA_ID=CAMNT_0040641665 /DNA_START=86 /DNA_END=2683 /DNA_ORIENTATION=+